jgi:hypothetical protein
MAKAVAGVRSGMPDDPEARDETQRAHWLLPNLPGLLHREYNAAHWEYDWRPELREDDREDDRDVVARSEHIATSTAKKSWFHRYRYPPQETAIKEGDALFDGDGELCGTVVEIDRAASDVTLELSMEKWNDRSLHPSWAFVDDRVNPAPKADALFQLPREVLPARCDATWKAGRALLWREPRRARRAPGDPRARVGAGPMRQRAVRARKIQGRPGTEMRCRTRAGRGGCGCAADRGGRAAFGLTRRRRDRLPGSIALRSALGSCT